MKKLVNMLLVLALCIGCIPILARTSSAAPIALNGGFESGLTGWTQTAGSGGVTVTGEQKASGTSSLKIVDASAGTTVAAESVKQDAASGHLYTVNGQVYLASGTATILLRFYDGANQVIGTPRFAHVSSPIGAWTGFQVVSEAPANAVKWSVYLNTGNSNTGTSYYDDIQAFSSAPAVLPLHDTFDSEPVGTTPNAYSAYGSGTVMVSNTPGGGNRSLSLHDQSASTSGVVALRQLEPLTVGRYEFETKFRYVPDSTAANMFPAVSLKLLGKNSSGVLQPAAQFRILKDGLARAVNATANNFLPNTEPLASDQWYTIRIVMDWDTKKYDVYLTSDAIQAGTYIKTPAERIDAHTAALLDQSFMTGGLTSLNAVTWETSDNTGTLHVDYMKMIRSKYTVGGKVVQVGSGLPIADATVKLYGDADLNFATVLGTGTTAADGSFTISPKVENGRYRLKAERAGFLPTTTPVTVWKSDQTDETIAMPLKGTDVTLETMIKPPDEHPRLYLRETDIPQLQTKMTDPATAAIWNKVLRKSEEGSFTAKSSGTTTALETYTLPSVQHARYVRIVGKGNNSASSSKWNSITEVKVYGQTQAGGNVVLPAHDVQWSIATGSANDGWKTIDGNLSTFWAAEGAGEWVSFDLGGSKDIHAVAIAWYNGNQRRAFFDIDVSVDGQNWTRVDLGMGEPEGILPPVVAPAKTNYNAGVREAIEARALRYLLQEDPEQGERAITMLMNFLNTVKFENSDHTQNHVIGDTINAAAIVYDWCYDHELFQQDKSLRGAIIGKMKDLAKQMEMGYPVSNVINAIQGHDSEDMLMKNLLAAGVAVYDQDPEIYNVAALPLFNKYVPARNFWYESGMHHQGDSYGMTARYVPELWAQLIMRRMGQGDIFSSKQGDVLMRAIYTRRPDGQLLRDGDSYQDIYTPVNTTWKYETASMLAAYLYDNPYVQDMFMREYRIGTLDPTMEMLFVQPTKAASSVNNLPLTRYFGSPMGSMVARTDWDTPETVNKNSPSVVAEMKIGGYWFGNHQHLDAGAFQLYYQGALAIDSGMGSGLLQPKTGDPNIDKPVAYGSAHDRNYYKRTIAHNSMLIFDPSEVTTYRGVVGNDGGQHWANTAYYEAQTLDQLVGKDYSRAKVTAHQFGTDPQAPEYSYIKGDLTQAYSAKAKQFERSMMFMNLNTGTHPAAMVVFDKVVSADSGFEKYWLLHTMEKPTVSGSVTSVTRSADGYSGKLVNQTLLPLANNLDITMKGEGTPNEKFDVFGTNYMLHNFQDPGKHTVEEGSWRVQVSPHTEAETDYFLNVMQVMDNGETATLPSQLLDTNLMTGAQIADRAVWFSKSGDRLTGSITLSTNGILADMLLTVADLESGTWRISMSGQPDQYGEVTVEGGVLAFRAPAGSYTLAKVD
ncbi:heparin/heparin-sulfate lyase HepB [Paenibacillus methanolicus]|uniref:Heparinase II/III-like protein n=1 Tax=Paenibacillus methanolicus TaxID=582686 RepID=A0A5S5CB00_9BACL|nr:heparin/heparin-sulfate lyase HepB [Paenibacillus methanolicus]TYP76575.1 heparinase II/III-like protein [Paenibacillus methanolicus]